MIFESNGGSVVETQRVAKGGCAVVPDDPVKDGYVFTGRNTYPSLTKVLTGNVYALSYSQLLSVSIFPFPPLAENLIL